MENGFHLLRLPKRPLEHVLRQNEPDDLFLFSLCSKSTKLLVKSLQIKAAHFHINIGSGINLKVSFPGWADFRLLLFPTGSAQWVKGVHDPIGIDTFEKVELRWEIQNQGGESRREWIEDSGFTVRQLIDHFMLIYNCTKINLILFFDRGERFDRLSLYEMARGFDLHSLVFIRLSMETCYKLVSETFLQAKAVTFHETPQIEPIKENLHKMVIQNLEFLCFLSDFRLPLQLQDLICIRIPNIFWFAPTISDQDLNRFLKLWMAGCNVELENFRFEFGSERVLNEDRVMSGIHHRVMGAQEQREKLVHNGFVRQRCVVEGAYVIQRKDGVEATVKLGTQQDSNYLHLIVWD